MHGVPVAAILLVLILPGSHVTGETYDDRASLRSTVLSGYQTDIRPITDQSQVLNISITAKIYKIMTVDAVQGTIKVAATFTSTWTDQRITWTPGDHNGATTIKIYKGNVWIPHLTHANPTDMVVYDDSFMHVTYSNTGQANYMSGDIIELMCQFNVMYWPFDLQECDLKVFAYDQPISDVQFVAVAIDTSAMLPNTEWTVLDMQTSISTEMGYSFATFKMRLKRQSLYYVMQIIIPTLGIATLNPLVFLLPSESGERVGYSTTILLSITVFLTIVGDSIPKTSDPFPLFFVLLTLGLLMGLMTTLIVLLNLNIFHRDDNKSPVTPRYRWLVTTMKNASFRTRRKTQVTPNGDVPHENENKGDKKRTSSFPPKEYLEEVTTSSQDDLSKPTKHKENGDDDGGNDVTWVDVSETIDTVCFWSLLMMHVIGCTTLTLVMAFGGN